MATESDVSKPVEAYLAMSERWALLHDLKGGTKAMRAAGESRLPKEEDESEARYRIRLGRSFLLGAYRKTIRRLSAKPFAQPIIVSGDFKSPTSDGAPRESRLGILSDNADGCGRSLTDLARDLFRDGVTYGMAHLLVDFDTESSLPDARPTLSRVPVPDVIGWRRGRSGGSHYLQQVRIRESEEVPNGAFDVASAMKIRVINFVPEGSAEPGSWQLWGQTEKGEWFEEDGGLTTYRGAYFLTVYFDRGGFMTAEPPLEELAELNLAHWQSYSDQRNILRFARAGVLFGSGMTEEEAAGIHIGPNAIAYSTNPDAKLQWVEHGGAAIGAGQADLDRLEEQMEAMAHEPLRERSGGETATSRVLDEASARSDVHSWLNGLQTLLKDAYRVAAKWWKESLPADFNLEISRDFSLSLRGSSDSKDLIAMREKNQISARTLLHEQKRRGVLSESLDIEEELSEIEPDMVFGNMSVPNGKDYDPAEGDEG